MAKSNFMTKKVQSGDEKSNTTKKIQSGDTITDSKEYFHDRESSVWSLERVPS